MKTEKSFAPHNTKKALKKGSSLEQLFEFQVITAELPKLEKEHQFFSIRKWRFDFAYPTLRLAIEIEGGNWVGGRHQTGSGFEEDCEKYSVAAVLGWRIIRATGGQVKNGQALIWLKAALAKENPSWLICP